MADRKRPQRGELVKAFQNYADAEDRADVEAIAKLFGPLPVWVPELKRLEIAQDLAVLRGAKLSIDEISNLVKQARAGRTLLIPGTAIEVGDINFIRSANGLAHIQWALSLPEARAMEEVLGKRGAQDYRRTSVQMSALKGVTQLRKPKITPADYEAAKKQSRRRKELALRLGVSLQAVRDFEKKKNQED
jgi:hypothetical protein